LFSLHGFRCKMEIGGVAIGASTVTSVFTATLRISQAVYELKAVGEQTRDLLDTTKHIDDAMRNVRIVRRQKSALLTTTEKEWIDREIKNSEKAVRDVAALIEPARVDMQKSNNTRDITFKNRMLFVLRDSPNVAVQLTKLSIATQGLNAAMGVLCNREGHADVGKLDALTVKRLDRRSSSPAKKAPPSYELSQFMNRRRTTGTVPRRKELNHRASMISFVAEEPSGDESVKLSTSRSQATLNTNSDWATREERVDGPEDGEAETKSELFASVAPALSSNSRDAPYLDCFDKSPACIPELASGNVTPHVGETHLARDGHDTHAIDTRGLEPLQALDEQPYIPTFNLDAQRGSDYFLPSSFPSVSASELPVDNGIAQMALSGNSRHEEQPNAWPGGTLPSHPPTAIHELDADTSQIPRAYSPPIRRRPIPLQPQHSHNSSMHSLSDGFIQQASAPNPFRAVPRSPPFRFLTPQMHSRENSTQEMWGNSSPPKPEKPMQFTSSRHIVTNNPPQTHHPSPPYPSSPISTTPFPALIQVVTNPLPRRPTAAPAPAHAPHHSLASDADVTNPPATHNGRSLAEIVKQDRSLQYYKPLPNIPFGRSPSVTSVTPSIMSTKSEPAGGAEGRMTRGQMWLEHHAERSLAMRELVGGPLSGGFRAPLPPSRVKEV
jgi:hypothetical protein